MLCEMCGKDVETLSRVRIERSVLRLCADCARFGTPIDPPTAAPAGAAAVGRPRPAGATPAVRAVRAGRRLEERDLYQDIGELELAPDWNKRVRIAREALGWTPDDLGRKLNEKKSVVLKLESGNFHPPDALVRKLERALQVRLRAEPEVPGRA